MRDTQARLLWRIDAGLWLAGAVGLIVAIIHGLRSGQAMGAILRGAWACSATVVVVLAMIAAIVLVVRWRSAREEADFLRKYPPRQ
jgi:hypothetical protein